MCMLVCGLTGVVSGVDQEVGMYLSHMDSVQLHEHPQIEGVFEIFSLTQECGLQLLNVLLPRFSVSYSLC